MKKLAFISLAAMPLLTVIPHIAQAQTTYTAYLLNDGGLDGSIALGISGNNIVGYGYGASTGNNEHAMSWSSASAAPVDLNPTGFTSSYATCASGGKQGGYGVLSGSPNNHALLWTGTATSVTDMDVAGYQSQSRIYGMSGSRQVGAAFQGGGTVAVWTGTPSSGNSLGNSGSALGIAGTSVVGYTADRNGTYASLWTGAGTSYFSLAPAGFTSSIANGVSGVTQVGNGVKASDNQQHALLWTGTAASVVDLNPTGYTYSYALGIAGSTTIGYGLNTQANSEHALLWTGSSNTPLDLQTSLPSNFLLSRANGISLSGDIVGFAMDDTGINHAVLWKRGVATPAPSSMLTLGSGLGFLLLVRRRKTKASE